MKKRPQSLQRNQKKKQDNQIETLTNDNNDTNSPQKKKLSIEINQLIH